MEQREIDAIAKEEEQRWLKAYGAILKEIDKTERHFEKDRTYARAMTSELVAARRLEDKMQLLNEERVSHGLSALRKHKVQSLDSLLDQPYFARMVCNENGRRFEFSLGTASFSEERIVDWRESPLAALYYTSKEGESYCEVINNQDREGVVELRRSYRGKGKDLHAIELPNFILTKTASGWTASEKRSLGAPVVLSGKAWSGVTLSGVAPSGATPSGVAPAYSRSEGQAYTLPPILSLLTPEQYALVTSPVDEPMIIQGGAGSGKTTVALHRLAWLLHEKNTDARAENCLVVMIGNSLKSYIRYTLPELGIHGVRIETFPEWSDTILKPLVGPRRLLALSHDAEVLAFKSLGATLDVLDSFVRKQKRRMAKAMEKELNRLDVRSRQFWQDEIAARLFHPIPVLELFSHALTKARQSALPAPFIALVEQTARRLSYFAGDLHLLWEDHELLEEVAEAHYSQAPLVWKKINDQLQFEVQTKQFDSADDALLLHLIFLKWGYYPREKREREHLDHIVIDEAQDFSIPELSALLNTVRAPHELTLSGDIGQKVIGNKLFSSWRDVLSDLGFQNTIPLQLTVAYRSTLPIMEFATAIRGTRDEETQYSSGKSGPVPSYTHYDTERDMLLGIGDWIRKRLAEDPQALCGIICRFAEQATALCNDLQSLGFFQLRLGHGDHFDFSPGIIVTDVYQVKGLEFRNVLLVNPSARAYSKAHPDSQNLLYVAVTRAEARLDLVGHDPPSPLLPQWLFEKDKEELSE